MKEELIAVVGLSIVGNRLIEVLVKPWFVKFKWDTDYLIPVSWIVASLLVAASQVNLFSAVIPNQWIGWILTAIVCGGGSNFIYKIFDSDGFTVSLKTKQ